MTDFIVTPTTEEVAKNKKEIAKEKKAEYMREYMKEYHKKRINLEYHKKRSFTTRNELI